MVTRNANGDLMWLELGNSDAGLTHIIERHSADLAARGVTDIPGFLRELLQTPPTDVGRSAKGPWGIFVHSEREYLLAFGDNGFIVSLYPQ